LTNRSSATCGAAETFKSCVIAMARSEDFVTNNKDEASARTFGAWLRQMWPFIAVICVVARVEMIHHAAANAAENADTANANAARAIYAANAAREAADDAASAARRIDCN
jgi:hypothetical protein